MTAANTRHGNFSAQGRAERHYVRTLVTRTRLVCTARLLWPYLPPDMAARLAAGPEELATPIHLTNRPDVTPQDAIRYNVKTHAKTAAIPICTRLSKPAPKPTARAVAAALAPWKQAIAAARAAERAARTTGAPKPHAPVGARPPRDAGAARPHAPIRRPAEPAATTRANRPPEAPAAASPADTTPGCRPTPPHPAGQNPRATGAPKPPAPVRPRPPRNDGAAKPHAPIRCPAEPAATARANRPPEAPAAASPADTTQARRPMPRRPAGQNPRATGASKPHAPVRPRPPRNDGAAKPHAPIRRPAKPAAPPLARLTPTKAAALRTTTLAETWTTDLGAELAQRFGHPRPAPGWRILQAMPATDPVANAARSLLADQQRPTPPATQQPATDQYTPSPFAGLGREADQGWGEGSPSKVLRCDLQATPSANPGSTGEGNDIIPGPALT